MLLSETTRAGSLLFLSGVVGVVAGVEMTFEDELARALSTVGDRLAAAGGGWDRVVDVTIFLSDMSYYGSLNVIYAEHFRRAGVVEAMPTRTCVAVKGLPLSARVELKVIARAES